LFIHLYELAGLVAEWGDFFICDYSVEIKTEYAVDVMATCDTVVAVRYVFVIFFRLFI
jgi:hypothetical protein